MSTPPIDEDPNVANYAISPTDENPNVTNMTSPATKKPIRLWPGVVIVALQLLLWFVAPRLLSEQAAMYSLLGAMICTLFFAIWWLFFSRAAWLERLGAIVVMVLAVLIIKRIVHPSIAGAGMGMMLPIFSTPLMCAALVAAVAFGRQLSAWPRRALMAVAIFFACGLFIPIRTDGVSGDANSDLHWRWTRTAEEQMLAQVANEPVVPVADIPVNAAETSLNWPGFRGPNRDGVLRGVRIDTDWSSKPPVAIWRRPVGPGWSSFAVRDNFVYTQEQRGNDELVSCYNLTTGKPVWLHKDAARFWESNAGAGPRGTPTLSGDRVYTFGATGIVNALNIRDGSVIWTRNAATDTKTKTPIWGFASSPLVVGDVVIVATAGALIGYDAANGNPRWSGPATDRGGYSSPHLVTIKDVPQVLLMNGEGVTSVNPADGKLLWKYGWEGDSIVQPALTSDGDVLLGSGSGLGSEVGVRRLAVAHAADAWTTQERWTSAGLKPYFNDFIVHKDLAFGFDGSNLACIDLKTGDRKWKGESYGHGQIVLLGDQDLLLVVSEKGEVALVKANADQFTELARFKAVEGKTWNHPVLVGDTLLVRNDREMAAFKLNLAKG
jgi:outer membrane protein assembly factor BamB